MVDQSHIRNFAIIAHIDHGKSTLADRMLELCGVVKRAEKQTLDSNPIERERGITIKLAPVRMEYLPKIKSETYILNLIDTPGHVDFSYEVSRALAACEGVVLLVDATKGVQAQTLAHYREAKRLDLKIIPVVNKIDLDLAEVDSVKLQLMEIFNFEEEEILEISAKTGVGVENVLNNIVEKIPKPKGKTECPLRALVFNSQYDEHQGVIAWIRLVDGSLRKGEEISLLGTKINTKINEVGYFKLEKNATIELHAGETGYVVTGSKDPSLIQVGDTMVLKKDKSLKVLPGYNPPKPMVFASFYPTDQGEYVLLGEALEKLKLLDSSLQFTAESSPLLGNGFRVGFLGILHAEIVQERLEREFGLSVFASQPSVVYKIKMRNKKNEEQKNLVKIYSPEELPDPSQYDEIQEPMLDVMVMVPEGYATNLIKLFQQHRGSLTDTNPAGSQIQMRFDLPLAELVGDFYSAFKSVSSGFASLDYDLVDWKKADLVKLDILLAGDRVSALSRIVPRNRVEKIGRETVDKLKEIVPRHNFEIAVQAAIGGKILARATIKPFRKDVTAKLYGGDQTRKDKLLKKQKKGKKKMKQMGRVSLPPDTFWKLLK